ncbi:MAG: hypothetical protein HDS57_03070 [Barnesiella sp.]|nr:hypothetical protein [Barnesiella sp.]
MKSLTIGALIALFISSFVCSDITHGNHESRFTWYVTTPLAKKAAKNVVKKATKNSIKKSLKQTVKKSVVKNTTRKLATKEIGSEVLQKMTKEQQDLFIKKGYRQISVKIKGVKKNLLVSREFDPNLKIAREYTGDFDPVKFHNGDSRFVMDGCETNLGRMKRGCAPLFKDPTNKKPKWHGYSEFELHHGGQKANPDYFALMGKEHETESRILHTRPKGTKSEIDRASFSRNEREPMYKDWAKQMAEELFPQAVIK